MIYPSDEIDNYPRAPIFVTLAQAQETSATQAGESSAESRFSERKIGLFLSVAPLPIISEGIVLGAEYKFYRGVSLWSEGGRYVLAKSNGGSFFDLGSTKATATEILVGLRSYPTTSGFFLGAGYKYASIYTTANMLFVPQASKKDEVSGAYAQIGYQISGVRGARWQWLVDLGVIYGPGQVKSVTPGARIDSEGARGTLETEVAYGFFPAAKIGGQF